MPPRKFLKNRCSEIESEGILEAKYHIMYINFKSQNICESKTSTIINDMENRRKASYHNYLVAIVY